MDPVPPNTTDSAAATTKITASTVTLWFALTVALVLSVLRIAGPLCEQDLWHDEYQTLVSSVGARAAYDALPYDEVLPAMPHVERLTPDKTLGVAFRGQRNDVHPPLYFMLVNLWRRAGGDTTMALRGLSIALVLLAQIPLAAVARRLGGDGAALLAGLLGLWCHSGLLAAAQIRPYALLLLLVNTSMWALLRLQDTVEPQERPPRRGPWIAALAALTAACLLTHYFSAAVCAVQAAYILLRFPAPARRWGWLALGLGVLGFAAVWGPGLAAQRSDINDQSWLFEEHPDHTWRTLVRGSDLPFRLIFGHEEHDWQARRIVGQALPGLVMHGIALWLLRRRWRAWMLPALWYGLIAVLLLAADLGTGRSLLAHLRYAAMAGPAMVLLVVLAVQQLPRRGQRAVTILAALIMLMTVHLPPRVHPDCRTAAQELQAHLGPDTLLVFEAGGWPQFWPRRMLGLTSYAMPQENTPVCMLSPTPTPEILASLSDWPRVVFLTANQPLPDSAEYVSPHIRHIGRVVILKREPDG